MKQVSMDARPPWCADEHLPPLTLPGEVFDGSFADMPCTDKSALPILDDWALGFGNGLQAGQRGFSSPDPDVLAVFKIKR